MAAPFSGSPTRYDMLFVEQMALYQYSGGLAGMMSVCQALSPGQLFVQPGLISGTYGLTIFKSDAGIDVVSIAGTSSPYQLLAELAASYLVSYDSVAGKVSAYYAFDLTTVLPGILKICDGSKPLVLMGHSLGGATAQLAAAYLTQRGGYAIQGVYTIGSPKSGNAAFAAAQGYPVYRLVNAGDIVPSIPTNVPGLAFVTGLPAPSNDWPLYVQTGTAITQNADGTWSPGATDMSAAQIVAAAVSGDLSLHDVSTYLDATRIGLPTKAGLQPFTDGYEKPWQLFGLAEVPPASNLTQGPPIPVPAPFTNHLQVYNVSRTGDAILLGVVPDPPPYSWVPILQAQQSAKDCCD